MSRRKLTVVEQAMKDAAAELKLPKDHWDVERLATLNVMLRVARHKWSQGQAANDANQMLALMDSITTLRREAKAVEPIAIEVNIRKGRFTNGVFRGQCSHCQEWTEYSDTPFEAASPAAQANPQPEATSEARKPPSVATPAPAEMASRDANLTGTG
jgi:hypothetical protein